MGLSDIMHYYFVELADDRVKDWPILNSPFIVPLILFSYLYFVFRCGPRYMKNRPPYSLKTFVQFYNVFQIIANTWIIYSFIDAGWFTEISVFCEEIKYTLEPGPMKLASTMWYTMILKLIDLVETCIFVLRKKERQISFLHIYHHISTVLLFWVFMRYLAGGMTTFPILVNCSVHVIMYTYYFLSSQDSAKKLVAKFKPYITIIQMVQFVLLMIYCIQGLVPSCPVPLFPNLVMISDLMLNFYLFYRFYQTSYNSKGATKSTTSSTKLKGR